jgi:predicted nucleic acid-binding protein
VILVDANIVMYAAGKESPQRQPCQALLREALAGRGPRLCTDAEVLQEILHRYRSLGLPDLAFRIFDSVVALGIPVLPVGVDEVGRGRRLLHRWPGLSTRDGVHLGVMEAHGLTEILSYDKEFDAVDWVRRLEP